MDGPILSPRDAHQPPVGLHDEQAEVGRDSRQRHRLLFARPALVSSVALAP